MKRRALLIAALATPFLSLAQTRVARVGFLAMGDPKDFRLATLREALQKLGHIEGKNLVFETRFADLGRYDEFDRLAAELVRSKVDVIVAPLNPEIAAARRATSTTPIVMLISGDPEGQGFVRSIARPGGNVTGLAWAMKEEIEEKSVEILAELLPGARRVAALLDSGYEITDVYWNMAERAARGRKLEFRRYRVRTREELPQTFADMKRDGVDAVLVGGGRLFNAGDGLSLVNELGLRHRLPLHYKIREGAQAGALVAYGPDIKDFYRRGAGYVDRILRGGLPAEMPVEHPTRYELVINAKTAKTLGVALPQQVLVRADEVLR